MSRFFAHILTAIPKSRTRWSMPAYVFSSQLLYTAIQLFNEISIPISPRVSIFMIGTFARLKYSTYLYLLEFSNFYSNNSNTKSYRYLILSRIKHTSKSLDLVLKPLAKPPQSFISPYGKTDFRIRSNSSSSCYFSQTRVSSFLEISSLSYKSKPNNSVLRSYLGVSLTKKSSNDF